MLVPEQSLAWCNSDMPSNNDVDAVRNVLLREIQIRPDAAFSTARPNGRQEKT